MPEHFHLLITPTVTLERAVQMIKGGFSFRATKEMNSSMEIWQVGFSDHRIRDAADYRNHVGYVYRNPVGRKLVESVDEYPYSSIFAGSFKDDVPRWLKPLSRHSNSGAAEAAPLQNPTKELVIKS